MKITRINVHQVFIPFNPLGSRWIGRKKPSHLDSTVVAIETDEGLTGHGESCPIAAIYLPAFAGGLRAALGEMAPALLGQDPTQVDVIYQAMDEALFGHGYAKAAVDIACWDLLGKATGLPVSHLIGGRFSDRIPAYASVWLDNPETMVQTLGEKRDQGYTRFQIKVGSSPDDDVARIRALLGTDMHTDTFMVDANRGWSKGDALRVVKAVADADCYIEQPCATYAECLEVRRQCRHPMILDEVLDSPSDLARALDDDALDGMVIKVTHAGGLTPARILRDMCAAHGIKMRLEDTAGSEITRAAQAQLAAATPLECQLGSYGFLNDMPPVATGAPEIDGGSLVLNHSPGLGVEPDPSQLGEPVASYGGDQ